MVLKDYKSGKSIDCGSCKHSTDFEQPFFKAGWRFIEVLAEGTAKMLITIRDSILSFTIGILQAKQMHGLKIVNGL